MKRKFTWAGIATAILLSISTFFVACNEDIPEFVRYNGKVVYVGTTNPFSALEVKITNGNKIHCNGYTDEEGQFSLSVKISEIDGSYYLLIGDETCIPQKIQLSGFGQGEVNIGTIEIEGPTLPTVSTKSITNISDNKATSGGNVKFDGRSQVTSRGVCWAKSEFPTTDGDHTENGAGLGEFTSQLTGLEPGSLYYVRAYATNQKGTSYGETKKFTTADGRPTVTTTSISMNGGVLMSGGNVTDDGGSPVTARGVCYGQYPHPDLSSTYKHTSDGTGTGYYTSRIGSFSGDIYVRAYATNANGTSYGQEYTANAFYLMLPTFVFNGTTYKVAPDPSITMTLGNAKTYCKGLELYGYSDWYLPTKDELYQMFLLKNSIGGFTTTNYWSSSYDSNSYNIYYFVSFDTGHISWTIRQDENMGVRPIRKVK